MGAIERHVPKYIVEALFVILGSFVIAIGFNGFLLPNQIASGGFSGVSIVVSALTDWKPAYILWALNGTFFLIGWLVLGKGFAAKTFLGTALLPLFFLLTEGLPALTHNTLVGAIFGGLLVGLGLGIVFLGNASTGGTDLIAMILHRFAKISLGKSVAVIDGLVVISSMLIFSVEKGLIALIALYVTIKVIDIVQLGIKQKTAKNVMVISRKEAEIRDGLINQLKLGVTRLDAQGGYSQVNNGVLMIIIPTPEFQSVNDYVMGIDPQAFVIVMDASEVQGLGFTRARNANDIAL